MDELIDKTIIYVKTELDSAEKGHDWWHIYRVWNNAKYIAKFEAGDQLVIELGALLHDIADSKFHDGDDKIGPNKARQFLQSMKVDKVTIEAVVDIIANVSFKGNSSQRENLSNELKIVMDADRLDALGAIGIARTFNYGGFRNREIYNPLIPFRPNLSKEEYQNSSEPSINHFYEKLLLLKDLMNTKTGKRLAKERHRFIELYLKHFYQEWELK